MTHFGVQIPQSVRTLYSVGATNTPSVRSRLSKICTYGLKGQFLVITLQGHFWHFAPEAIQIFFVYYLKALIEYYKISKNWRLVVCRLIVITELLKTQI